MHRHKMNNRALQRIHWMRHITMPAAARDDGASSPLAHLTPETFRMVQVGAAGLTRGTRRAVIRAVIARVAWTTPAPRARLSSGVPWSPDTSNPPEGSILRMFGRVD